MFNIRYLLKNFRENEILYKNSILSVLFKKSLQIRSNLLSIQLSFYQNSEEISKLVDKSTEDENSPNNDIHDDIVLTDDELNKSLSHPNAASLTKTTPKLTPKALARRKELESKRIEKENQRLKEKEEKEKQRLKEKELREEAKRKEREEKEEMRKREKEEKEVISDLYHFSQN